MNGLRWCVRIVVAGIFIYAGAMKVVDPAQFLVDIESFRLISGHWAVFAAFILPWLEISAGFSLLSQRVRGAGGLLLVAMLLVFMLAIGAAMVRGIDISCGCFGGDGAATEPLGLLLRDLLLLGAVMVAAGLYPRRNL